MRIVFMGSPEFALPSLDALAATTEVVGVVTQPDRPSGRGRALREPPVKRRAAELGIDVFQPARLKDPEAMERLARFGPDLIVVAAYGRILKPELLALPPLGCLNVHASLLPRWRGAAPVQAAILAGDEETGVTIMKMDAGLDTGPILAQRGTSIASGETGGELEQRLSALGAVLLTETLPSYASGELEPTPQTDDEATYAPLLKKSDGALDFSLPAAGLARQVRAYEPWPSSFFSWQGSRVLVRKAHAVAAAEAKAGHVREMEGFPAVETGEGILVLDIVQPAGKPSMPGPAFARGARGFVGAALEPAPIET